LNAPTSGASNESEMLGGAEIPSVPETFDRWFETMPSTASFENACVLFGDVLLGFLGLLVLDADDGHEDMHALLALLHAATKLVPCAHASHTRGVRLLPRDFENAAKAVVVRPFSESLRSRETLEFHPAFDLH
jgi:hypothetical protein